MISRNAPALSRGDIHRMHHVGEQHVTCLYSAGFVPPKPPRRTRGRTLRSAAVRCRTPRTSLGDRHGIASAIAMWPSKPSSVAIFR